MKLITFDENKQNYWTLDNLSNFNKSIMTVMREEKEDIKTTTVREGEREK